MKVLTIITSYNRKQQLVNLLDSLDSQQTDVIIFEDTPDWKGINDFDGHFHTALPNTASRHRDRPDTPAPAHRREASRRSAGVWGRSPGRGSSPAVCRSPSRIPDTRRDRVRGARSRSASIALDE